MGGGIKDRRGVAFVACMPVCRLLTVVTVVKG